MGYVRVSKADGSQDDLGISRQTLYRHVGPDGSIRPDGRKLLKAKGA